MCMYHVMGIVFSQIVSFVSLLSWHCITTTLFQPQLKRSWQEVNSSEAHSLWLSAHVFRSRHVFRLFSALQRECTSSTVKYMCPAGSLPSSLTTSPPKLSHSRLVKCVSIRSTWINLKYRHLYEIDGGGSVFIHSSWHKLKKGTFQIK